MLNIRLTTTHHNSIMLETEIHSNVLEKGCYNSNLQKRRNMFWEKGHPLRTLPIRRPRKRQSRIRDRVCSSTFLRGVAHPKSSLTETVTLVEIEGSHSMMEVDKAVTQTAPVAESRLEPTPTREQTALGRRFRDRTILKFCPSYEFCDRLIETNEPINGKCKGLADGDRIIIKNSETNYRP